MKLANDQVSFSVPRLPALDNLVTRLERLSSGPEYAMLRETVLASALKPYLEGSRILAPLAEEVDLATFILYCDVYPDTGQLSLIEWLRDVVTEHIGLEERIWLDPLKHSYTDLLEVTECHDGGELLLRSMGDGTNFRLPHTDALPGLEPGDALLSREESDMLPPLHCFDCQQKKLPLHIGMDGASEFMPSGPGHLKTDSRVTLRVKIDASQPMTIDNHPIPFYLGRDPFKHGRAKVMAFRILISNTNDSRQS